MAEQQNTTPATVSVDDWGKSRPKLLPEDLEGDVAILTIAAYEQFQVKDTTQEDGTRTSGVLRFEETGDKALWLNKSMMTALIERLGNKPAKWVGQRCPVEKRTVAAFDGKFPKVYVMAAEEWDTYLNPHPARRSVAAAKGKARK
jgi:hypothetical protein